MLSVMQGGIKYHFLSLWFVLTRDWTQVSRAIGEHSNHYANVQYIIVDDPFHTKLEPHGLFFWAQSMKTQWETFWK